MLILIRELRQFILGGYLAIGNRKDRLGKRLALAIRITRV